jgi:dCTP deaminase
VILVDRRIREAIAKGELGENFEDECVQPASYDLRIGRYVYSPASRTADKPYDLSSNGGWYRIGPYDLVVLETHEVLKMPTDHVGRLGLQSRYARKGLIASLGPQVDPGFEGKLFVTMQNCTNAAHILSYKDTFLTIEYTKLDEAPSDTYHGPYQHRREIGPDVLSDLVRLEGLSLGQMQSQFTELSLHVKEWSRLAARFDEFLTQLNRHTAAIEELTRGRSAALRRDEAELEETRDITLEQAMAEVLELFRRTPKGRLYYSDIAEQLKLDFATVIEVCEKLVERGEIEGAKNG